MGEWVGWECLGHHMASSPLLLEGRKIMVFFCETVGGGGTSCFLYILFAFVLFKRLSDLLDFFSFCDKVQLKANRKYSILVNNPYFGYWRITLLLNCSQARCWDEKYGSTETSEVGYLMVFGLSIFFIAFNLFIRIFLKFNMQHGRQSSLHGFTSTLREDLSTSRKPNQRRPNSVRTGRQPVRGGQVVKLFSFRDS